MPPKPSSVFFPFCDGKHLNSVSKKPTSLLRTIPVLCWAWCLFFVMVETAAAQGVCDRTPQVRDALVEKAGVSDCGDVTAAHLSGVRSLFLRDTGIRKLQEHDFSGLDNLGTLWLQRNSLSRLPEGILNGLSSLSDLIFDHNPLSELPERVFTGLSNLETLTFNSCSLESLPEGVFQGLGNLRWLDLTGNFLASLPKDIFRGLNSLETLWMRSNPLDSLPKGIFDDILDTLGASELSLDSRLRARLSFSSVEQTALEGTTVSVPVTLNPALPVAVHVPFSLGGTATDDDYANLSPHPNTGLLFLAGETFKEITFTLAEDSDSREETITLTLGELSSMGLRRSDGIGPDAPYLMAETLLDRPDQASVHTVTVSSSGESANVCDRTPQVRDKLTELAGRSRCEDVTAGHLARVTMLDLSHSDIVWLHNGDFEGLSQLRTLNLSRNYLKTLPEEIFHGLNSLAELFIHQNKLIRLPEGVFNGLSSLRALWLQDNSMNNILRELPSRVFDDVLDTLEDLRVDPYLMSTIAFQSVGQNTVRGYTVRVRVRSARGLPVAFRLPYSVEWTATTNDAGLPPLPDGELLFPARRVAEDIVFTLSEDANSLGKTIEVRLGELSRIRLSRSDGTGPDAPHLSADFLLSRPDEGAVHTVTIVDIVDAVPADVCDRTPQVRDALLAAIPEVSDCAEVTTAHLTGITRLRLLASGITILRENDFNGLNSLQDLWLSHNSLRSLPEGVFSELGSLKSLGLSGSSLDALPESVFMGLHSLQQLFLHDNRLHLLPEEVFRGLNNLRELTLFENSLSTLPEGVFNGMDSLQSLILSNNNLSVLPERVFSGLSRLEGLWLHGNALSSLPQGIFHGLNSLRSLLLGGNSLTTLPEGVFSGLSSLQQLWLSGNGVNALPEGIFHGLSDLEELLLHRNSLSALPEGVFRDLSSLDTLWLASNSLTTLPEGVFRGLKTLNQVILSRNSLSSLPVGVFRGLSGFSDLRLESNPLSELPRGIFDDVLDSMGHEVLTDLGPYRGELVVDPELKARIAFSTTSQRVAEGAKVRIPVTLSRALPVAVRVPYTVGVSGSTGGVAGLSPSPDSGLLFPAGETEREITLTLPKDAVLQGERTVLLALGDLEEIGLRRSDGTGPDARYLKTESLLLGSDHGSIHSLTVSDFEPDDQDPFCLSLWDGAPCSTVTTLPYVLMGPLGESMARTELVVTHRDPQATDCQVAVLFHQGAAQAPAVSFDGQFPDRNLLHATIPRGGAEILTLTAPDAEEATVGAVSVFTRSACTAGSLHVQGRALLENRVDGEVDELYSLAGQSSGDLLGDGGCRMWTGRYGNGGDVVFAMVPAQPGQSAPPGTQLHFRAFDLKGNLVGALDSLEVTGRHQAFSPGEFDRPTIIQMCLDVPGASAFRLAVSVLGIRTTGTKVQFATGRFPGNPESEDNGSGP